MDVASKCLQTCFLDRQGLTAKKKPSNLGNEKAIHLKLLGSSPVPFTVITKYTIELQPSNDFMPVLSWNDILILCSSTLKDSNS